MSFVNIMKELLWNLVAIGGILSFVWVWAKPLSDDQVNRIIRHGEGK